MHKLPCTNWQVFLNREWPNTQRMLNSVAAMFKQWTSNLAFEPQIHDLILCVNLQFLIGQSGQMRELMKRQRLAQSAAASSTKKAAQADAAKQLNVGKPNYDKFDKANVEAQKQMKINNKEAQYTTSALLGCELPSFFAAKTKTLLETMGQMAACQFQYSRRLGMLWQQYLQSLGVDPSKMMSSANNAFASVGDKQMA